MRSGLTLKFIACILFVSSDAVSFGIKKKNMLEVIVTITQLFHPLPIFEFVDTFNLIITRAFCKVNFF